jgi:hypothetical protein
MEGFPCTSQIVAFQRCCDTKTTWLWFESFILRLGAVEAMCRVKVREKTEGRSEAVTPCNPRLWPKAKGSTSSIFSVLDCPLFNYVSVAS